MCANCVEEALRRHRTAAGEEERAVFKCSSPPRHFFAAKFGGCATRRGGGTFDGVQLILTLSELAPDRNLSLRMVADRSPAQPLSEIGGCQSGAKTIQAERSKAPTSTERLKNAARQAVERRRRNAGR